jgi:hypothetical protein
MQYVRQHTSAYVSIRQRTVEVPPCFERPSVMQYVRQHTSAYVSIQWRCLRASSARLLCNGTCVSIRFTPGFYYSTCVYAEAGSELDPRTQARHHPRPPLASHQRHKLLQIYPPVYVSIRQHTSAYVGIRQHTSAPQAPPDLCTCRRRGTCQRRGGAADPPRQRAGACQEAAAALGQ